MWTFILQDSAAAPWGLPHLGWPNKTMTTRKTRRYYHASPRRFNWGQILTGGHAGGYWRTAQDSSENVCLTTSPVPHVTIFERALKENWTVYEVEPLEDLRHQRPNGNDEVQAHAVCVIRRVGPAKGLAKGRRSGSVVHGRRERVISSLSWRLAKSGPTWGD